MESPQKQKNLMTYCHHSFESNCSSEKCKFQHAEQSLGICPIIDCNKCNLKQLTNVCLYKEPHNLKTCGKQLHFDHEFIVQYENFLNKLDQIQNSLKQPIQIQIMNPYQTALYKLKDFMKKVKTMIQTLDKQLEKTDPQQIKSCQNKIKDNFQKYLIQIQGSFDLDLLMCDIDYDFIQISKAQILPMLLQLSQQQNKIFNQNFSQKMNQLNQILNNIKQNPLKFNCLIEKINNFFQFIQRIEGKLTEIQFTQFLNKIDQEYNEIKMEYQKLNSKPSIQPNIQPSPPPNIPQIQPIDKQKETQICLSQKMNQLNQILNNLKQNPQKFNFLIEKINNLLQFIQSIEGKQTEINFTLLLNQIDQEYNEIKMEYKKLNSKHIGPSNQIQPSPSPNIETQICLSQKINQLNQILNNIKQNPQKFNFLIEKINNLLLFIQIIKGKQTEIYFTLLLNQIDQEYNEIQMEYKKLNSKHIRRPSNQIQPSLPPNIIDEHQQKETQICHHYLIGNCKNKNCSDRHQGEVLGFCNLKICQICYNKIKFCIPQKHTNNCQLIHLNDKNLVEEIKKSMEEQWKSIIVLKKKLTQIDDDETRDAAICQLNQLLTQRKNLKHNTMFQIQMINKTKNVQKKQFWQSFGLKLEIKHFIAKLPAYSMKEQIWEQLKNKSNNFCLIIGHTGSGKTTQTPQYLYQRLSNRIICVQPRKISAISLARRIAEEMNVKLGEEVGYEVGPKFYKNQNPAFKKNVEEKINQMQSYKTRVLFVTEEILLKKIINDKKKREKIAQNLDLKDCKSNFFNNVGAILLDEIHERSMTSDLIFGTMKEHFIKVYPQTKIYLASATVNKDLFQKYFNNCPIVQIPGQTFPVDIRYRSSYEQNQQYIKGSCQVIKEVVIEITKKSTDYMGHIIVFLTAVDEMDELKKLIEDEFIKIVENYNQQQRKLHAQNQNLFNPQQFEILYLHGKLSNDEQQKVFNDIYYENDQGIKQKKIKIILSTKIAESSVTVNGIKIVIDCGYVKESEYDSKRGITVLNTELIDQSAATQRAGRAGRTSSGICYRLYSQETFYNMSYGKIPEINRVCLDQALLKIIDFGLDPRTFPYFERPDEEKIEGSLRTLEMLEALTIDKSQKYQLTEEGKIMLQMSIEPRKVKCILEGVGRFCYQEVIQALALESNAQSMFKYKFVNNKKIFLNQKNAFPVEFESDFLQYFMIYQEWIDLKNKKDENSIKDWLHKYSIQKKSLEESKHQSKNITREFEKSIKQTQYEIKLKNLNDYNMQNILNQQNLQQNIMKSILQGYVLSASYYSGKTRIGLTNYFEGFHFYIHKSSNSSEIDFSNLKNKIVIWTQLESTNHGNRAKHISILPEKWLDDITGPISMELNNKRKQMNVYEQVLLELPKWATLEFQRANKKAISEFITKNDQNNIQKIQISINENGNGIQAIVHSNLQYEAQKFLNDLKQKFILSHKKANIVMAIPNTECAAIIQDGLRIVDILFPGQFITVQFDKLDIKSKYPTDLEIANKLNLKCEDYIYIVRNQESQYVSGKIRFSTKEIAQQFYQNNQLLNNNFEIIPLIETPKLQRIFESHLIKIQIPLANSTGNCLICFQSYEESDYAANFLKNNQTIPHTKILLKQNSIVLQGLSQLIDEFDIKQIFNRDNQLKNLQIQQIYILRDNSQSQLNDQQIYSIIISMVTEFLSKDQIDEMTPMFHPPKNDNKKVINLKVVLPDDQIAQNVVTKYNKSSLEAFGINGKVRIKRETSRTIFVNRFQYQVKYEILLVRCALLQLQQKSQNLIINLQNLNEIKEQQSFQFKIKIISLNNKLNEQIAKEIETVLMGSKVSLEIQQDTWKLFTAKIKEFYQQLMKEYNIEKKTLYISWDSTNKLVHVISNSQNTEQIVIQRIQEMIKNPENMVQTYEYNIRQFRIKLILEYLKNLKKQNDLNQEFDYTYNLEKKFLKIFSNVPKETFDKLFEQFKSNSMKNNQNQFECISCYEPLENDYTNFLYCGHQYCKACNQNYIKSQVESDVNYSECHCMFCPQDQNQIAYKDLREIAEGLDFESLFKQHLDKFIMNNLQIIRYCPSNECNNILQIDENKNAQCKKCQQKYCFNFNNPHKSHPGKTCLQFIEENDEDIYIQKMIDNGEMRISPCCQILFQKNDGCNHIRCQCGQHWCYACHFKTSNWSYSHFSQCSNKLPNQKYYSNKAQLKNDPYGLKYGICRMIQCCKIPIEKTEGCLHITCKLCSKHSCWACLNVYDNEKLYDLHQAKCSRQLPEEYRKKYHIQKDDQ